MQVGDIAEPAFECLAREDDGNKIEPGVDRFHVAGQIETDQRALVGHRGGFVAAADMAMREDLEHHAFDTVAVSPKAGAGKGLGSSANPGDHGLARHRAVEARTVSEPARILARLDIEQDADTVAPQAELRAMFGNTCVEHRNLDRIRRSVRLFPLIRHPSPR